MTLESLIDPGCSIGELVAGRPVRAQPFERLRLDYCCGWHQTLAAACTNRGLDLDDVLAALQTLDERGQQSADVESRDWREVGTAELCAHIVTVHHDGLREAFPRIERLLATVARVHGNSAPRLRDAQRRFSEIRTELEPHLASEETELFPACIASDQTGTPVEEHLLEERESEHAALGHALGALRILCGDYDRQAAVCNPPGAPRRAGGLRAGSPPARLRGKQHPLPRARRAHPPPTAEPRLRVALDRAGSGPSSEPLPACCEEWIAVQSHSWAAQQRGR